MTISFTEVMDLLRGGLVSKLTEELNRINLMGTRESVALIGFLIAYLAEVTGSQNKDAQEAVLEMALLLAPEIRKRAFMVDPNPKVKS